ncbi:MAG: CrcB family protein [Candidatus Bathyarchaeota archaeon]|nr:CrcB family protein [Candidatus Bathyarchaeota archaeon]
MPTLTEKTKVGRKMHFAEIGLLAFGAVMGALLRYQITESPLLLGALQVNVLIANVLGSFILGAFSVAALALNFDAKYSLLVAVGFCGSLTTMSSFALETSNLLDNNSLYLATVNILANVGLSLGAVLGGRAVATIMLEALLR